MGKKKVVKNVSKMCDFFYSYCADVTGPTRDGSSLPYRIDEIANRRFSVVLRGDPFGTCDRKKVHGSVNGPRAAKGNAFPKLKTFLKF